ncbi:hypothetical protein EYF80_002789 [Liparis tanakae]|uniref:Uncharacterized protein n=1 Tax=Liparis tanakae TaxID=230148 RepID=A0A4Z2JB28_9TELE|nr:hypothetical protein EYF80_002789 [Liparis tanakae]
MGVSGYEDVLYVVCRQLTGLLCLPVLAIGHPAAWLHVCLINAPEAQFLFVERPADISRAVQLTGSVVVEDMCKHPRVAVEEELLALGIIVKVVGRIGLGQPGEASAGQSAQGAAVCLMSDPSHVYHNAILVVAQAHGVP